MSKRTHKLQGMGDVAAAIDAAPSLSAAAKVLGVDRSTLHRWMKAGKVIPRTREHAVVAGDLPVNNASWAEAVRKTYHLTETDRQLLALAEESLQTARTEERATTRLLAMGRFQALVKQLSLSDAKLIESPKDAGLPAARVLGIVRRPISDPRAALMAVK